MNEIARETAVLVAVGPEGLAPGTVAFVADTAQRLGLGIELVHVVPTPLGGPTGMWDAGVAMEELTNAGRRILAAAVAAVRDRAAVGTPVDGDLVPSAIVGALVERSRDSELVVLQHRRGTDWERRTFGSVAASVAARAHAPVASVPASWDPETAVDLPITVGVKGYPGTEGATQAAVWAGVGMAAITDRPLKVLRAVPAGDLRAAARIADGDTEAILACVREELEEHVGLGSDVESRLPVTFEVMCGHPADVLIEASATSALMVVARHEPHLPLGSHLGPVARHLIQLSACPVLVVDPAGPATLPADAARQPDAQLAPA